MRKPRGGRCEIWAAVSLAGGPAAATRHLAFPSMLSFGKAREGRKRSKPFGRKTGEDWAAEAQMASMVSGGGREGCRSDWEGNASGVDCASLKKYARDTEA